MAKHAKPLSFREPDPGPWPILIGLLLAVLVAGGGVWAVRNGMISLPGRGGPEVAIAVPTDTPAAAANAPTDVPIEVTVAPATNVPATVTPAATPTPSPLPTSTLVPVEATAALWAERWNAADYDGMWELLDDASQEATPREAFVERYLAIADRVDLQSVRAEVTGPANYAGDVPMRVAFTSGLVGEFAEETSLSLVRDGEDWKVEWTPGAVFTDLGEDRCVDIDRVPVKRGAILDRNGLPLAIDGTVERLAIIPGMIDPGDEERVLQEVSALTGMAPEAIRALYADADPSWVIPIKDFPVEREAELLSIVSQLSGVTLNPAAARLYPLGKMAAHVTGYVSEVTTEQLAADPSLMPGQRIGQAGLEFGADALLTGTPGARILAVDCVTRSVVAEIAVRPAVPPKDVVTTIDAALQRATWEALRAEGDVRGAAVVVDPRTGAIEAMVSLPSYDPSGFALGFTVWDRLNLASGVRRPLQDRAAEAAYPTGSIFKVITFAAGMEDLGYTGATPLDCPSQFMVEGSDQVWNDWTVAEGLGPQGMMDLHRALVTSCNTIFYGIGKAVDDLDPMLLPEMARGFGLGEATGIPFFPEVSGNVPDPAWKMETYGDGWATGDAVNLSIGQGAFEATPLQMAMVYAAIANGGDVLQPYLVAETVSADGTREQVGERIVRKRVPARAETIAELQSALRDQTTDPWGAGSSRVFGDFDWPIAGKTGTAQTLDGKTPHSWFAAFGPVGEEATIATAVMVENAGEGVAHAAPVTRRIYEAYRDLPN